jgi:hypothetical protein
MKLYRCYKAKRSCRRKFGCECALLHQTYKVEKNPENADTALVYCRNLTRCPWGQGSVQCVLVKEV